MSSLSELLLERPLLLDGAMGTQLLAHAPGPDDFGGPAFEGCLELLNLRRPAWIQAIYGAYLDAGADAVETHTFGANAIGLKDFHLEDQAEGLNETAARLALDVARSYDRPRFVVGSMGPGSKLLSLGQVDPDALFDAYLAQARGLIKGGVDALLLETCQDLGQIKTAIRACHQAFSELLIQRPLWVQVTVEKNGTLLLGSDLSAVITALEPMGIDLLGLNCGLGPFQMDASLALLNRHSPFPISCLPNAGLPENRGGKLVYDLSPQDFAQKVAELCQTYNLNVVGGCCGTTPDHIRALYDALQGVSIRPRNVSHPPSVSSLYQSLSLDQTPKPFLVGERANANGSKAFRELLKQGDFDAMTDLAKKQTSHALDICVAYAGRDEGQDMETFIQKVAIQSPLPLVVDSTDPIVMERALKRAPGRCILNSINLEDGGIKAREILKLAKDHGACVIGLLIDERGMAKSLEHKLDVADRLMEFIKEAGLRPSDLILDPLTFTLGTGDASYTDSARVTLEALREIKRHFPETHTILGVSNASFGLSEPLRRALNAAMLFHAVEYGLDLAICNPASLQPLTQMDADLTAAAEALIFNRGEAPLKRFLAFGQHTQSAQTRHLSDKGPEAALASAIFHGDKSQVGSLIARALETLDATHILNEILLSAMKDVGDAFREGRLQLPFVLESAECMRLAVSHLKPHLPKHSDSASKGRIVLATVKGDVHDIGKNLVAILLENNGFEIIDLGVQQSGEAIAEAIQKHQPMAVGMSGLLVKSLEIMGENLQHFSRLGFSLPVLVGGAAMTRDYAEHHLAQRYPGPVLYAQSAFDGLKIAESLANKTFQAQSPEKALKSEPAIESLQHGGGLNEAGQSAAVLPQLHLPKPPFWGVRQVDCKVAELLDWLDEDLVIRNRWAFRRGRLSEAEYQGILHDKARPLLEDWKRRIQESDLLARARYGYFAAQSSGNCLSLLATENHPEHVLEFPRQKTGERLCIADFFSNVRMDVAALQLVSLDASCVEWAQTLYRTGHYADYFIFHGLMTELTEAFATRMHASIRQELGIEPSNGKNLRHLAQKQITGARYSFGYPACPDLSQNQVILARLEGDKIFVSLSGSFQMQPEYSTCALIVSHPQARHFAV